VHDPEEWFVARDKRAVRLREIVLNQKSGVRRIVGEGVSLGRLQVA
jgi:hypothetical protein